MTKYEIFDYDIDVWGDGVEYRINDVIPTGIIIYTDVSEASIYKKLKLGDSYNDPDKLETNLNSYTGIVYVYYNRIPLCELHEIK